MKVLLCSVFGPYAVDDAYGRKENKMELLDNQVTREQGIFSQRYNHQSWGLYFIAANIDAEATVLDFPRQRRFIAELRRGYDYVGISFIVPNFAKARRMAELVRTHAPQTKIILGGHGTRIPNLEQMIEHDFVCRGEGVRFMRELLGEDPSSPLTHPLLAASLNKTMAGIPVKNDTGLLICGVGCPNACRFCSTSHYFERQHIPFFSSGRELFAICQRYEEEWGMNDFFIMDENFLKRPERARELLRLMEEHGKTYRFSMFSSAEAVAAVGADFLARLGAFLIWIGVESKHEVYEKNRGIDLKALIRQLRVRGISVLASGILFLEYHTPENLQEDVEFLVGMEADFVQFMQLGPMPQTELYLDYDRRGLLRHDIPFEEWHGQHRIWFRHPHFSAADSERYLRDAFRHDYDRQGSSMLRLCETALLGLKTLMSTTDPYLQTRVAAQRRWAETLQPIFAVLLKYAHTSEVRAKTRALAADYAAVLGPLSLLGRMKEKAALAYALREQWRIRLGRTNYQPQTLVTHFEERHQTQAMPVLKQMVHDAMQLPLQRPQQLG